MTVLEETVTQVPGRRVSAGQAVTRLHLAAMRTTQGIDWSALATAAHLTSRRIEEIESGLTTPTARQLGALLGALGAPDDLATLTTLSADSREAVTDRSRGWAARLSSVLGSATSWRSACGGEVPLGLRTARFHEACLPPVLTGCVPADRSALATIATTAPGRWTRPLVLLDEVVLDRPAGGPATAAIQLEHLLALQESRRVSIAVVVSEAAHPGSALIEVTARHVGPVVVELVPDGVLYRTGQAAADAISVIDSVQHRAGSVTSAPERLRWAARGMRARTRSRRGSSTPAWAKGTR
ncbi:Scr1 family TA system antitoxin-like transcriptional regulator [Kitasatospora sp. NPDC001603]|uniref:Scr1 family TA system antitoxin-like transcriptional regulator n=1 Tax=Kitasatospora sp. NPDC001603 TaxID=3154388 RepID=UPI003328CDC7